ncbi:regulator of microtubule dynamics protein 2 isoform X3 [Arvicola amphibius]|uniref:regulator of microtubule dynamics protein 2 isoform X3 n=1 Tax=Arvicola amphibius TaxID=1047088 RepID=UPI0018E36CF3|nr:regulator of microtubule dynamics protein 2 isoform X3 [Arvicola amphibius]
MPHSTKKELILGIMVGTAGISLLALWYHKIRKTRITMNLPKCLSLGKKFNSLTLQDETHSEQGASVVFQRRQLQILEKLNELLTNMEELKEEIKFLKETIPKLEEYLQDELGGKVTVHKISPQHRARKKRPTTAPSAATNNSSEEAESEGGCQKDDQSSQQNYPEDLLTPPHKHLGSSCILRPKAALGLITCRPSSASDTRRLSQNTSTSLSHDGLPSPYKDVNSLIVEVTSGPFEEKGFAASPPDEDTASPIEMAEIRYITANTDTEEQSFPVAKAFNTHIEELKLDVLLQKVDRLRINEANKVESFELLCDHKEKFSEETEFLWRLTRAYGDMYDLSTNTQEKKHYANIGKTLGERAITRAPMNGQCHLWYAILCGYVSEFEGLQNKINCGHLFKEHLDKAIQLLPEEPFLYYLKGRYCYTVSKLSWIEKKMAATLFGEIPSSTVHEALQNFLKAEELQPGYSVSNYMFVAKCYVDLEESQDAWKFCNLALLLPIVTKEDKESHKEVKKIICSLKR